MSIENLIQILQAAIAPCVYISGLGLVLLCLTNRLARPVDRIRIVIEKSKDKQVDSTVGAKKQVTILYKRCKLLKAAIAFNISSILMVSLIMFMLFSTLIFNFSLTFIIKALFTLSLVSFILSLICFLMDVRLTLYSVGNEVNEFLES